VGEHDVTEPLQPTAASSDANLTPESYYQRIDSLSPEGYLKERQKHIYQELQNSGIPQETEILILATIWTALCNRFEI
jgi:hypothetical protein